ncbi:hypothetical protein BDP27DRAFT_366049 [Rhodocollybia butyracea]|uniref:Uncharacterized protein n=1 Tax=Rhodocollybia butyracea TaxID=206335 RepID=A0A9P5PEJ2_9AGAR|nr:hypothetical protein BDP27DRAFT_366049 [Rhodocollybia butyracea]
MPTGFAMPMKMLGTAVAVVGAGIVLASLQSLRIVTRGISEIVFLRPFSLSTQKQMNECQHLPDSDSLSFMTPLSSMARLSFYTHARPAAWNPLHLCPNSVS